MSTSLSNWNWVMPDKYVADILARETVATGLLSPVWLVQNELRPHIQEWANRFLVDMHPSGSFMKGTCNKSGTDVDLFISLSPDTAETLSEIHDKLCKFMTGKGYKPRPQNVSVNITVAGYSVDLVPGKLQNLLCADHSLYRRKADTWTKTNVQTHIEAVRNSNRLREIRVLKLWRNQKKLDFPSFYLELSVMRALEGEPSYSVADNVQKVFKYLDESFLWARITDPANTNNIISDDLTVAEKIKISTAAKAASEAPYWRDIVL
jgi:hypothetical protein